MIFTGVRPFVPAEAAGKLPTLSGLNFVTRRGAGVWRFGPDRSIRGRGFEFDGAFEESRMLARLLHRSARVVRSAVFAEPLEARRLLAVDIVWLNRGLDGFDTFYGANAAAARNVVDRAIADWEQVITSFNRIDGTNVLELTINAASLSGRAETTNILTEPVSLKPISATISLDDNGGGSGWYFDPVPSASDHPDDGEFSSVESDRTAFGSGIAVDFYRSILREIATALGIYNGGRLASMSFDVGDDPISNAPAERLIGVDFNSDSVVDYTLTTVGGGKLFEGGGGYVGPVHPDRLMNPGRLISTVGRRQLISSTEISLLRDVLGYSVVNANNTFVINLNATAGTLTVTGNIGSTTADQIDIDVNGSMLSVRVTAGSTVFAENVPLDAFSSIIVNSGSGNDTVTVNELPAGKSLSINLGSGDDELRLAAESGDFDSNILGSVSVSGGGGFDAVRFFDAADDTGPDTWLFVIAAVTKGGSGIAYSDIDSLIVDGSAIAATYQVNALPAGMTLQINAGTAADSFIFGGGDFEANVRGTVTVNTSAAGESIVIDDTSETGTRGYDFTANTIRRTGGAGVINHGGVAGVTINNGPANDTILVPSLPAGVPLTINGGAGDDVVSAGGGNFAANVLSSLIFNGGEGTDRFSLDNTAVGATVYTIEASRLLAGLDEIAWGSTRAGVDEFVLNLGLGDDTVNVESVDAGDATIINLNGGNDVVNVAPTTQNLTAAILSPLTVAAGAGLDTITFFDALDHAGNDSYTVTDTLLSKPGFTTTLSGLSRIVLNGSQQPSAYELRRVAAGATLVANGGAESDSFVVGNSDFDSNVFGLMQINAGNGTDTVVVDDSLDTGVDTWILDGNTLSKNVGSGLLTFASAEQLTLNGSLSNTNYEVRSIPAGRPTFINGTSAIDILRVGAGLAGNMASSLTFDGGGGVDSFFYDDSLNAGGTYTLTTTTFGKGAAGSPTVTYLNTEIVNLTTSNQADQIVVESSPFNASFTINGGAGNDTLRIEDGDSLGNTDLRGDIIFFAGDGSDALIYNDEGGVATYFLSSTQVRRTGSDPVSFDAIESITINGGSSADTFNINSVAANTPVILNGSGGNDRFSIGNGNWEANLFSNITITGGDGVDRVIIEDLADVPDAGETYTITSTRLTKSTTATRVDLGSSTPGVIVDLEELVLNAGGGSSTIDVLSYGTISGSPLVKRPVSVTINGGDGDDLIRLASGGHISSLVGLITVNGGTGNDQLIFNDFLNPADVTFTINNTNGFDSSWDYSILWNTDIERKTINAGTGKNTFNVNVAQDGFRLNSQAGDDRFNILATAPNTFVEIVSGEGFDTLEVNADRVGFAGVSLPASLEQITRLNIYSGGIVKIPESAPGSERVFTFGLGSFGIEGVLDLTNNTAVRDGTGILVNYYSSRTNNGYNGGLWNGAEPAIISSTAANSEAYDGVGYGIASIIGLPRFGTFQTTSEDVVLRYTLLGDLNLNRSVGFEDLLLLARRFNTTGFWYQGDVTYDGLINFSDMLALGRNYGLSSTRGVEPIGGHRVAGDAGVLLGKYQPGPAAKSVLG